MSYKYAWYNLPTEIRNKIVNPLITASVDNEELLLELKKVNKKLYWFNSPSILNELYNIIKKYRFICDETIITTKKFNWFNLPNLIEVVCLEAELLITCLNTPSIVYNFDMTSTDWGTIVDADSFKAHLENESGESGNVVEDFILEDGRLRCNLSNITLLYLYNLNITDVNICSIDNLVEVQLYSNNISVFNPNTALSSTLTNLDLNFNQMTVFNTTLPLPSTLEELYLRGNQIENFNPSIQLPEGLIYLDVAENNLVDFNPDLILPITLEQLILDGNQITTAGYTTSETWATNQDSFTTTCEVILTDNTDSITGTNLETILLTKNTTIIP